jgi:hypothetical protein
LDAGRLRSRAKKEAARCKEVGPHVPQGALGAALKALKNPEGPKGRIAPQSQQHLKARDAVLEIR